jgi:hypothetical protein
MFAPSPTTGTPLRRSISVWFPFPSRNRAAATSPGSVSFTVTSTSRRKPMRRLADTASLLATAPSLEGTKVAVRLYIVELRPIPRAHHSFGPTAVTLTLIWVVAPSPLSLTCAVALPPQLPVTVRTPLTGCSERKNTLVTTTNGAAPSTMGCVGQLVPVYLTSGTRLVIAALLSGSRYTDFHMPRVKTGNPVLESRALEYGAQSQPPEHPMKRPALMSIEESKDTVSWLALGRSREETGKT